MGWMGRGQEILDRDKVSDWGQEESSRDGGDSYTAMQMLLKSLDDI